MKNAINKVKEWCKKNGKKVLVIGGVIIILGLGIFFRKDITKLLDLISRFAKDFFAKKAKKKRKRHTNSTKKSVSARSSLQHTMKPANKPPKVEFAPSRKDEHFDSIDSVLVKDAAATFTEKTDKSEKSSCNNPDSQVNSSTDTDNHENTVPIATNEEPILEMEEDKTYTEKIREVKFHFRKLGKKRQPSKAKRQEAEDLGIQLGEHQTFVPSYYRKYRYLVPAPLLV